MNRAVLRHPTNLLPPLMHAVLSPSPRSCSVLVASLCLTCLSIGGAGGLWATESESPTPETLSPLLGGSALQAKQEGLVTLAATEAPSQAKPVIIRADAEESAKTGTELAPPDFKLPPLPPVPKTPKLELKVIPPQSPPLASEPKAETAAPPKESSTGDAPLLSTSLPEPLSASKPENAAAHPAPAALRAEPVKASLPKPQEKARSSTGPVVPAPASPAAAKEVVAGKAQARVKPAPVVDQEEARRQSLRRAFQQKPIFDERIKPVETPAWQKAYTLGAGDVLNLSLFKRPDLARSGIVVAPDGTISYLQAIGIRAAGRTVDQLRQDLETSLKEYHEDPRVAVSPSAMTSKRYTIIGRVREPGSYPLTRPTSVLEALATAQGVEVGSVGSTNVEIADMEHSFVTRQGRKLDVDLGKLYREGDFAQNALLEPDDYIYIASALKNEYYVLGAVNRPGRRKMPTRVTVLSAITEAGSYHDDAWRGRVLLVRGSIHHPETRVIDVNDILHGRSPDVVVENRDIIYVSKRPFVVAEHALDAALKTFMQTVTAERINQEFISLPAAR